VHHYHVMYCSKDGLKAVCHIRVVQTLAFNGMEWRSDIFLVISEHDSLQ